MEQIRSLLSDNEGQEGPRMNTLEKQRALSMNGHTRGFDASEFFQTPYGLLTTTAYQRRMLLSTNPRDWWQELAYCS